MSNLTVLEQGLIPVYQTDTGEFVVDGRELWEGLQSKQDFSNWAKKRFVECEALENEDYSSFNKKIAREKGATIRKEYTIKLDTAKEMAMMENNAIGKQVRKYFIAVEKKSKKSVAPQISGLTPEMQMFELMFKSMTQAQATQQKQQSAIENMDKRLNGIEESLIVKKQVNVAPFQDQLEFETLLRSYFPEEVAPKQTELTFKEEFYKNPLRIDRISTERIATTYSKSSISFYKKLQILGFVVPSEQKGWVLDEKYENKGIGYSKRIGEYWVVTWTKQGHELIKHTLKDNGICPVRKLTGRRKRK